MYTLLSIQKVNKQGMHTLQDSPLSWLPAGGASGCFSGFFPGTPPVAASVLTRTMRTLDCAVMKRYAMSTIKLHRVQQQT